MQLSSLFLVYYTFAFWANRHSAMKSSIILYIFPHAFTFNWKTNYSKELFDGFFLSLYILYLSLLVLFPLIIVNKVSIACRIIILMEQVRLLMKSHAFVRSNTGKIVRPQVNPDKSNTKIIVKRAAHQEYEFYCLILFS